MAYRGIDDSYVATSMNASAQAGPSGSAIAGNRSIGGVGENQSNVHRSKHSSEKSSDAYLSTSLAVREASILNVEPTSQVTDFHRGKRGPPVSVCVNCRNLKLKCDRQHPCLHCARRKIECVYRGTERDTKGRSKAKSSTKRPKDNQNENSRRSASPIASRSQHQDHSSQSVQVIRQPPAEYTRVVWFDHLLDILGPSREASKRTVAYIVEGALSRSNYHWFQMIYLPGLRRSIMRERDRAGVNPALALSLVAIGLRERNAIKTYGVEADQTLIPDEMIPPARTPWDVSERVREAAQAYLSQTIMSSDGGMAASGLETAQAALLLMLLEPEMSPGYIHYLGIASVIMRSDALQSALNHEAMTRTGNRFQDSPLQKPMTPDVSRSSTKMEEAARLRLLPVWWGSRIGIAYLNVEITQSCFRPDDIDSAFVFNDWPEDPPRGSQNQDEMANNLRARVLGLNVMMTNLHARFLPYDIDYTEPSPELTRLLRYVDDDEFMFAILHEVVDWSEPSYFKLMIIRFCTSVCHLHGIIIRRLGFAHCDALRQDISSNLRHGKRTHDHDSMPSRTDRVDKDRFSNSKSFQSPVINAWPEVLDLYMTEMDVDFAAHQYGAPLQLSKFQLDVLKLYVATTVHLRNGITESLFLAGQPRPEDDPIVRRLVSVGQQLGSKVRRHEQAMRARFDALPPTHGVVS